MTEASQLFDEGEARNLRVRGSESGFGGRIVCTSFDASILRRDEMTSMVGFEAGNFGSSSTRRCRISERRTSSVSSGRLFYVRGVSARFPSWLISTSALTTHPSRQLATHDSVGVKPFLPTNGRFSPTASTASPDSEAPPSDADDSDRLSVGAVASAG